MRTVAFAPGRVNLIGEHTDYNAGFALPFAIDRGVTVRTTPLPGEWVMARADDLRETDDFSLRDPGHAEGWRAFVRGTVAELHPGRAARIEISGDVPRGGGLSSSAALGVALGLALCGEDDPDRRALARLCSKVENEWVGARTGLLDQYASLLAAEGHALLIDFAHDTVDPVPLDLGGWQLVVVRAGSRELAGGAYNDRRRECHEAAQRLDVHTLRWADADAAAQLDEPWRSRALHVITENDRVLAAVDALRGDDLAALGPLLDASHASLRDQFAVSTDEVERVVDRLKAGGAAGARLIGGGFGGHVLALYAPGARLPSGSLAVAPSAGATVRSS
jgi:galactokinase